MYLMSVEIVKYELAEFFSKIANICELSYTENKMITSIIDKCQPNNGLHYNDKEKILQARKKMQINDKVKVTNKTVVNIFKAIVKAKYEEI